MTEKPVPAASLEDWLACDHCDALLHRRNIPAGAAAVCPFCGSVLLRSKRRAAQRTLAFSVAGLLFYVPANFLPIMSFELLGNDAFSTLYGGVLQLWQQGYWWMSFLVCTCSMVMPLLALVVRLILAIAMYSQRFGRWHRPLLRAVHSVSEWDMLEVYMLGILVAFIKMSDLGTIHLGVALLCFVGLLISTLGATLSFDSHACWEQLDRAVRAKRVAKRHRDVIRRLV
ncbi:Paraquat-inducible protein A family protein [gamma proteobacterium HdN1]|nr:Paraquat-inducible protein A family protein [gamma proteobacterium HdN1]